MNEQPEFVSRIDEALIGIEAAVKPASQIEKLRGWMSSQPWRGVGPMSHTLQQMQHLGPGLIDNDDALERTWLARLYRAMRAGAVRPFEGRGFDSLGRTLSPEDRSVLEDGVVVLGQDGRYLLLSPRSAQAQAAVFEMTAGRMTRIADDFAELVAREAAQIRELSPQRLRWLGPTAEDIARLSGYRELETLILDSWRWNDELLGIVTGLPRLTRLELDYCEGVTEEVLERLEALGKLESLVVSRDGEGQRDVLAPPPRAFENRTSEGPLDATHALLVAGKDLSWREYPTGRMALDVADAVDRWRAEHPDLVAIACGDTEADEVAMDEETTLPLVVGVRVASVSADDLPLGPLSLESLRAAMKGASDLPEALWRELAELTDDPDLTTAKIALYLCAAGPLAHGYLVYGAPTDAGTKAPRGLKLHLGADSSQRLHAQGVLGVRVAAAEYESDSAKRVRLGDKAATGHAKKTEQLEGERGYYLFASYD